MPFVVAGKRRATHRPSLLGDEGASGAAAVMIKKEPSTLTSVGLVLVNGGSSSSVTDTPTQGPSSHSEKSFGLGAAAGASPEA